MGLGRESGENGLTTTTQRDAAYQITSHSTAAGAAVKSSVAHGYDAAGRRKYAQYEDTQGQAYAYDNAGQVKNVLVNTTNPATANPASSPSHIYNYDAIRLRQGYGGQDGNRNSALAFGSTTSYSANSVNAYTNISGGGILPPSQNPTYDLNGNMLTGPVGTTPATLGYDKENRLRTLAQNNTTVGYTYDALGRLIETVSTAATDNRERYTWSGWTLLSREIFTGTSPTSAFRYTWGLDLSGTMEGAGGVGGLLAIERNVTGNNTWDIRFPHYDANGNIIALTDNSGTLSARYRYDAFGNTLVATDVDNTGWATQNIHRFSTKPTFGNTTLLYYGYRWYDPYTGRWPSRDTIEEDGGMNLYGFVGNDGVNWWDDLGFIRNQAQPVLGVKDSYVIYTIDFRCVWSEEQEPTVVDEACCGNNTFKHSAKVSYASYIHDTGMKIDGRITPQLLNNLREAAMNKAKSKAEETCSNYLATCRKIDVIDAYVEDSKYYGNGGIWAFKDGRIMKINN